MKTLSHHRSTPPPLSLADRWIDGDADGGATFRYSLKGEVVNNSGNHISQAKVGYDVMLIYISDRWESLKGMVVKQKEIVKQAEGVFTWENANAQARIMVRNLDENTYAVTGEAYYGVANRPPSCRPVRFDQRWW